MTASGAQPAELVENAPSDGAETEDGAGGAAARPRRSALVQERSRQTRQRLVRAALELWTERGFENGIEETTADEIARSAGVTKGTFYFHFAHKEDILLEIGWGTSDLMRQEATAVLARALPVDATIDELLVATARRVSETPRAVVARTLEEFYRRRPERPVAANPEHSGFRSAFLIVFSHAQEVGELAPMVDPVVVAAMLETLATGAIHQWILDDDADLLALLRYRAAVLLAGVREVAAQS